jgi:hypothetical protein
MLPGLAEDEPTPLAMIGGLVRWLFRLGVASASTLRGLRAWVIDECPVAPGRRANPTMPGVPGRPAEPVQVLAAAPQPLRRGARKGTKTARFLAAVAERHGPLHDIPLAAVSKISAQIAPVIGLDAGAARTALRKAVLGTQDGGSG